MVSSGLTALRLEIAGPPRPPGFEGAGTHDEHQAEQQGAEISRQQDVAQAL